MIQTLSTTTHVARKRHLCDNCGRFIQPGQSYESSFIVENGSGDSWQWKTHASCQALINKLADWGDIDESGLTSNDFQSYVAEDFRSRHGQIPRDMKWPEVLEEVKSHHGLIKED